MLAVENRDTEEAWRNRQESIFHELSDFLTKSPMKTSRDKAERQEAVWEKIPTTERKRFEMFLSKNNLIISFLEERLQLHFLA